MTDPVTQAEAVPEPRHKALAVAMEAERPHVIEVPRDDHGWEMWGSRVELALLSRGYALSGVTAVPLDYVAERERLEAAILEAARVDPPFIEDVWRRIQGGSGVTAVPRGFVDGVYHLTATEYDRALRRAFEDGRSGIATHPDVEALRGRIKGISLPPGPDFTWVDGHRPFIAAALEQIDEWAGSGVTAVLPDLPSHGVIEYDDHDEWLTETDSEGASRIVARDVPRWFGRLVVAALASQVKPDPREAEYRTALEALLDILNDPESGLTETVEEAHALVRSALRDPS